MSRQCGTCQKLSGNYVVGRRTARLHSALFVEPNTTVDGISWLHLTQNTESKAFRDEAADSKGNWQFMVEVQVVGIWLDEEKTAAQSRPLLKQQEPNSSDSVVVKLRVKSRR